MRKPIYKNWWFWVTIVVFFFVIVCVFGSDSSTDTPSSSLIEETTSSSEEEQIPDKKTDFKLNETYTDSRQSVTITAVEEWHEYSEYSLPTEGYVIVRAYVKFKNISSSSDMYISSWDFNCYADNKVCSEYIWSSNKDDLIGGEVSPGRETEGWIYFEVPEIAKSIELEYETNVWSSSCIIFILK